MESRPWLVMIDPQRIFADPHSEWCAPRFAETLPPLRDLTVQHGERCVVTRWVPLEVKRGSWAGYFDSFPFADREPSDPMYEVVPEVAELWPDGIPHVGSDRRRGVRRIQRRGAPAGTGDYGALSAAGHGAVRLRHDESAI